MSLADKLNTLLTAKTNIKTALTNKGQDMSSTPFTEYYNTINNLSTLMLGMLILLVWRVQYWMGKILVVVVLLEVPRL